MGVRAEAHLRAGNREASVMPLDDITGADKCTRRRPTQSVTDMDIWAALEKKHPGLLSDEHTEVGSGCLLYVPRALETPRARARRLDDGRMTAEKLAEVAGVCIRTAYRARQESRG